MAFDNIDAALNEIKKDATKIVREAVKKAAAQAQEEVIKTADDCLKTYYGMYQPKKYKRTYSLHKAITPIFEEKAGRRVNLEFTIGVSYDANKLKGIYKSNSWYHQSGGTWVSRNSSNFNFDSGDNGIPEPEWILSNYLEGIHPGGTTDPVGTDAFMSNFFEHVLPDKINEYVIGNMMSDIMSKL
jgi:hypothetical protein